MKNQEDAFMNTQAQGLPINFIVLAAAAVLILVLIVMFVFNGFQTSSVDRQKAINECSTRCLLEVQWETTGGTFPRDNSKFCMYSALVKGLDTNVTCPDLVNCKIEHLDCFINCTGNRADCI